MRASYLFTSESVSEGHPDKVCDRISDEIVDLVFREAKKTGMDPAKVRIACETLATTNRVVIAGGALPTPDDWGGMRGEMFGAYSIGLKIGLPIGDRLNVAAGYQWGRSFYDKESDDALDTVSSTINVHAPYLAVSLGDDDSRLSATLGYAFKHHTKNNVEFNDNAALLAVGGDTRFARNWKVAGEIIMMQKLGVVPLIGTVRYFSDNYAFDLGVGYVGITTGDTKPPAIPLVPVVSGVFVF